MWRDLCTVEESPPGSSRELVIDELMIALYNIEGTFYALDGVCPHNGGPLGKGRVVGCIVTCPWHGWQFNVTDGQHQLNMNFKHTSYPVRVQGNQIQIELPG
jgi:nitrite reductase (NADH) small subunit